MVREKLNSSGEFSKMFKAKDLERMRKSEGFRKYVAPDNLLSHSQPTKSTHYSSIKTHELHAHDSIR